MKSSIIVSIMVLALAVGSVRMQTATQPQQGGLLQGGTGMLSSALNSITGTLSRAFSGSQQQQQPRPQQPSLLGGGLNQLLSRQGNQLGGGQMSQQQLMQLLGPTLDQVAREIQSVQQQLSSGQLMPMMRQQQGMSNPISTLLQDLTTLVRNLLQLGGSNSSPSNNNYAQMLQGLSQQPSFEGQQGLPRNPSFNGLNTPNSLGGTAQEFLNNLRPNGSQGFPGMQSQGGSAMNPSNYLQQGLNRLPSGLSRSDSQDNMMPSSQTQQQQQPQPQQPQQPQPQPQPQPINTNAGGYSP